jgi:hypothetical protein
MYVCDIIALNMHALTEDKCDNTKDSYYDEVERAFDQFPKRHMKMILGYFIAFVGREDISKPTIVNESLHLSWVRVINVYTSKNVNVRSTMFPSDKINKYTWTSLDGKTDNETGHVLIDRRQ